MKDEKQSRHETISVHYSLVSGRSAQPLWENIPTRLQTADCIPRSARGPLLLACSLPAPVPYAYLQPLASAGRMP